MHFFKSQNPTQNEKTPLTNTHYDTYGTCSSLNRKRHEVSALQLSHLERQELTTTLARSAAIIDKCHGKMLKSNLQLEQTIAELNQKFSGNGAASNSIPSVACP